MIIPHQMKGKSIAVLGLGRSGMGACHALLAAEAKCYIYDDHLIPDQPPKGAIVAAPDDWPWAELDALVISPGIPTTYPEPHLAARLAKTNNVPIMSDIALMIGAGVKAKIIGITGTNGKSTTTSLVTHLLNRLGISALSGGNIGTAVMALDDPGPDGVIVLELSSYQLDISPGLKLDAAAVLNITPDHLDRHGGWDGYLDAKARIADALSGATKLLIGDDAGCQILAQRLPSKVQKINTSCAPQTDLPPSLRGAHNQTNIAAAISLLDQLGITASDWGSLLSDFAGLPHRMEWVAHHNGVDFINDSKATNGVAAAKALSSFPNVYWIAGGQMKDDVLGDAINALDHVCHAYLIGECADSFAAALKGRVPYHHSGDIVVATRQAYDAARHDAKSGATVLLSPAAASFDQFTNFEDRGNHFRDAVATLFEAPSKQDQAHV
jgi:UDP-N-acetylmuramoylalanine--D-glutamate ligase